MPKIFSKDYDPTQRGWSPRNFDAIEIQGVRNLAPNGADGTNCEIDNDHPEFFSVYLHYKQRPGQPGQPGGVDCVGDFSDPEDAVDYAIELARQHGWPITYLTGAGAGASVTKARPYFGDPCKVGQKLIRPT